MEFVYYNPIHRNIQNQPTTQFTIQHITKKYSINKINKYAKESLYDIYCSRVHREFFKRGLHSNRVKTETFITKRGLRRHHVFMETEYLEEHYEDVSLFLSPNKTATIEAFQPKSVLMTTEPPEPPEPSNSYPKGRMPIFSFCRGLPLTETSEPVVETTCDMPNKITVVFPAEHPQEPFYLYIDDVLYTKKIHCCHLDRVKQTVGKYIKSYRRFFNCISCGCVLHKTNWTPDTHVSDIIKHHRWLQQFKETIKYDILLEELAKAKHLDTTIVVWILEFLYVSPFS